MSEDFIPVDNAKTRRELIALRDRIARLEETVKATARPDAVTHAELTTNTEQIAQGVRMHVTEPLEAQIAKLQKEVDSLHLKLAAMHAEVAEFKCWEYVGVHRSGKTYRKGNFATYDGSLWACLRKTDDSPGGKSADWQLCTKGFDARSASR